MNQPAVTRDNAVYDPEREFHSRYPEWTLRPGLEGAQGDNWVMFQPHLRLVLLDPTLHPEDRRFAIAMTLALFDMGAVTTAGVRITDTAQRDAEDLAELYFDLPVFDPSVPTAA